MFQQSVIGQSNPSPYRLIWKKFLPLYKTVYSLSSRKQGWSVQRKNIYKSPPWCQMNEMWAMNHVEGWAGSAFFHYHNWPTSLFAITVLIPWTRFKFKILKKCHTRSFLWNNLRRSPFCVQALMSGGNLVCWALEYPLVGNQGKGKVSKYFISFIFHTGTLGILPHQ